MSRASGARKAALSPAEILDQKVRVTMAEKGFDYAKATDFVLQTDSDLRESLLNDKEE